MNFNPRKKLSNFSQNLDWARDSNNYVAKRYMDDETERDTYFQDVKLQMDAKLWGEEYNRHNPPKKVRKDDGQQTLVRMTWLVLVLTFERST